MSSTVFYDNPNQIALLTVAFTNASGVPEDPTTVTCVVTDPAGGIVTHSYQGATPADIVRGSTGNYTLSVACSPSVIGADGLWSYVFVGTGAVSSVHPGTWRVLPLSIGTWYAGMEELKDRLGIADSEDDSSIQIALQAATACVNEWCGRHFYQVTETRTFRPSGIWLLNIDDVVTVTSCKTDTDGDGVYETVLTQGTDYQLRLGDGLYNVNAAGVPRPYTQMQIINSGQIWPFIWPYTQQNRVQVTGTWGWPAVPPPVAEATLALAAERFKRKDAPFGVAGETTLGTQRIAQNPYLVDSLYPYVRGRRKVGV